MERRLILRAAASVAALSLVSIGVGQTASAGPDTGSVTTSATTLELNAVSPQPNQRLLRGLATESRRFSAVGISWPAGEIHTVSVRLRTKPMGANAWTPWKDLGQQIADDGGSGTRAGIDLVWTGPSYAIEVEVRSPDGARLDNVRVDLIDPGSGAVDIAASEPRRAVSNAAVSNDLVTIASRADWGADEKKMGWDPEYAPKLKAGVLHHTFTTNDYAPGDVPAIIRSIYHYHAVTLDWGDIGYNVVVDKFGRAWQGRAGDIARPLIGAHAGGFNTGTTGVSMIGDYTSYAPPAAVVETVSRVIGWKFREANIDPWATTVITGGPSTKFATKVTLTLPTLFPHKSTSNTACPGAKGEAALQPIRDRALSLIHSQVGDSPDIADSGVIPPVKGPPGS